MAKHSICVVDDEEKILNLIKEYLTQKNYLVHCFNNGNSFLKDFLNNSLDAELIILDIMLPDIDGYQILKEIRKVSEVPVIMRSAKGEEFDKVLGLELGSDDYMSKPFSLLELEARIKKTLRRLEKANANEKSEISINDFKIDTIKKIIYFKNSEVTFSPKEYEVLYLLAENKNKVLKRDLILENVWGPSDLYDIRMVDDVIKRIRKKFLAYSIPLEIKTMWGLGYKLEEKKNNENPT